MDGCLHWEVPVMNIFCIKIFNRNKMSEQKKVIFTFQKMLIHLNAELMCVSVCKSSLWNCFALKVIIVSGSNMEAGRSVEVEWMKYSLWLFDFLFNVEA